MPSEFQLPDLLQHCPFELRIHPDCRRASSASDAWLREGASLSNERWLEVKGLKAGLLASMCYPTVDYGQFRVCCDFLNLFFFIRCELDAMDPEQVAEMSDVVLNTIHHPHFVSDCVTSILLRSVWSRLRKTTSSSILRRLALSIETLFMGLHQQSFDRATNAIPDLESFIDLQHVMSGCSPAFILLEYAHGMRLPYELCSDPRVTELNRLASDLVSWSNDVLSFSFDQARGSFHNVVFIIMYTCGYSIQQAIDHVANLHRSTIQCFVQEARSILDMYSPTHDADIAIYIRGLQDWIIGSIHWGFETERYFGDQGDRVRMRRRVSIG